MLRPILALTTAALAAAPALQAQAIGDGTLGDSDQAAYLALTTTPVGALPPTVRSYLVGAERGITLRGRFGNLDEPGDVTRRNFAIGLDVPFARTTVGLTAGYVDLACNIPDLDGGGLTISFECKSGMMAGGSAGASLFATPLGVSGANSLSVGLEGSAGYGTGDILEVRVSGMDSGRVTASATTYSFAAVAPVAIVVRSGSVTVVPHLQPGVGYGHARLTLKGSGGGGRIDERDAKSGMRFLLGGGMSIIFNGNLGVDFGVNKTFVRDGKTVVGFGLSWRMR